MGSGGYFHSTRYPITTAPHIFKDDYVDKTSVLKIADELVDSMKKMFNNTGSVRPCCILVSKDDIDKYGSVSKHPRLDDSPWVEMEGQGRFSGLDKDIPDTVISSFDETCYRKIYRTYAPS